MVLVSVTGDGITVALRNADVVRVLDVVCNGEFSWHRNSEQRVEAMAKLAMVCMDSPWCAWIRQSELGICRCIVSFAIDYVVVTGAGCVGARLVGEDGSLRSSVRERYDGRCRTWLT